MIETVAPGAAIPPGANIVVERAARDGPLVLGEVGPCSPGCRPRLPALRGGRSSPPRRRACRLHHGVTPLHPGGTHRADWLSVQCATVLKFECARRPRVPRPLRGDWGGRTRTTPRPPCAPRVLRLRMTIRRDTRGRTPKGHGSRSASCAPRPAARMWSAVLHMWPKAAPPCQESMESARWPTKHQPG